MVTSSASDVHTSAGKSWRGFISAALTLGLPIERDLYFPPRKTISAYAEEAHATGYIRA